MYPDCCRDGLYRLSENSVFVIASGAKQSICGLNHRLLRRLLPPRNDKTCIFGQSELKRDSAISKCDFYSLSRRNRDTFILHFDF